MVFQAFRGKVRKKVRHFSTYYGFLRIDTLFESASPAVLLSLGACLLEQIRFRC